MCLSLFFAICFFAQDGFAVNLSTKKKAIESDDTPWEITADSLSYNEKEGTYLAQNNVIIKKASQALYTEHAVFNTKTGMARVSGGVRIETDGDIMTGKEGTFNLNTQTGEIIDGNLFMKANHYYISGSQMQKTGENTYKIDDCTITTCDGEHPDWTITGSEVKVTIEGYGTVKHSAFRIRDLPIIYIPYMIFPAKTKRQTGLLPPKLGYSTLNGAEVQVPFYWAISDQTDATFYQRYMTKRGYMQGLEFRYAESKNSKGILDFDILSDKEDPKNMGDKDALNISPYERTNQTRYWLRGRSDQDLPLGLVARLDGDFVSDQDYLREFEEKLFGFGTRSNLQEESNRPVQEKRSPTRRSALRLSRDGESYALQGIAAYYQQVEDPETKNQMEQPMGGLNFTLLPEQFSGWPVFFNLETDYNYVWSDNADRGHGISFTPQVNFPFWLGPYVEFEPSFRYTYNSQWVDNNQGDKDRQYQSLYEASTRLGANAEKIYDVSWGNAKKLRHKVSPTFYYTYQGYHDGGEETPWYNPIDQEDYGSLWSLAFDEDEENRDKNRITFALENFLDARIEDGKGNVTYSQWIVFRLNQGYDISEPNDDNEPLTPLTAELIVTPFPSLDLRGSTGWDHYENTFSRTTLSPFPERHFRYYQGGELTALPRYGGALREGPGRLLRNQGERRHHRYRYYQGMVLGFRSDGQHRCLDQHQFPHFHKSPWLTEDFRWALRFRGKLYWLEDKAALNVEQNISSAGWLGYQGQCWGIKLGAGKEASAATPPLSWPFAWWERLGAGGSAGSW